jgi:hypothetical protein
VERIVGGRQLWDHVQDIIESLPSGQKAVILLRDMEGRDADEACEILGITAENQRVLLHRARGRIRAGIDKLTTPTARTPAAAARVAPSRPRAGGGVARAVARLFFPGWFGDDRSVAYLPS